MVNPITGPFSRTFSSASVFEHRVWSRQKPPFNLSLPGSKRLCINTGWGADEGPCRLPSTWPAGTGLDYELDPYYLTIAKTRVIERVLEQLRQCDAASLGVALAQYSQAERTIVQRSRQLLGFSRALRRLDLPEALSHLRVGADQYRNRIPTMKRNQRVFSSGWRGTASEYGGAWLEWSWGIAPTVDDIVKSVEILNSDRHLKVELNTLNEDNSIKRRGFSSQVAFRKELKTSTPYSKNFTETGRIHYKMTGTARAKSTNRLLFNQLGLDEPLKIGFEVIPWSFLLSWISNVETYLDNWSPIRDLYTWENLCISEGKSSSVHEWWNNYPGSRSFVLRYNRRLTSDHLPTVGFFFKPLRFGPQRAANAIALLATFLKGQR